MTCVLFVICGIIVGWVGIDIFINAVCKMRAPVLYRIGFAFIGGFMTYEVYMKYFVG